MAFEDVKTKQILLVCISDQILIIIRMKKMLYISSELDSVLYSNI